MGYIIGTVCDACGKQQFFDPMEIRSRERLKAQADSLGWKVGNGNDNFLCPECAKLIGQDIGNLAARDSSSR